MAKRQSKKLSDPKAANAATIGFEEKLWTAADKLRGSLDAAEYKHVVLGLLFLKYIPDAFHGRREELDALSRTPKSDWYTTSDSEAGATWRHSDKVFNFVTAQARPPATICGSARAN